MNLSHLLRHLDVPSYGTGEIKQAQAMTSSGDRTSSLTPACIAGAARVTLKALSSREIARLLVRLAPGLPAYRRRETRHPVNG
jgi:hypothetical protein